MRFRVCAPRLTRVTRDAALLKVLALRNLYEHPNTNEHEAASARAMAAKLRKKFDIPESEQPKPKQSPYTTVNPTAWDDLVRRTREAAANSRAREAAEAETMRARRAKAQQDWFDRMRYRDAMGQHLSGEDLREAQRDPLGWAAKQDKRTAQEKQRDMQDSFGQPHAQPHKRRACTPKLPFYDIGGEPRRRNTEFASCVECGRALIRGEGAEYAHGYACCDTVPGPRSKKRRED